MLGEGNVVAPVGGVLRLLQVAAMPAVSVGGVEEIELAPLEGAHGCSDGLGSGRLHGSGASCYEPAGKEGFGDHVDGWFVQLSMKGAVGRTAAGCLEVGSLHRSDDGG